LSLAHESFFIQTISFSEQSEGLYPGLSRAVLLVKVSKPHNRL
jgi:hypothetical protein